MRRRRVVATVSLLSLLASFISWASLTDNNIPIGHCQLNKLPAHCHTVFSVGILWGNEVSEKRNFLFTAYERQDQPKKSRLIIYLNTMDGSRVRLDCCIFIRNQTRLRTQTKEIYRYGGNAHFHATKYSCSVPAGTDVVSVSLTPSTCSNNMSNYVPIRKPAQVPGGLAICAKTIFGEALRPQRLVEWIEIQKLLGVDKILIFDLDCPENIRKILNYYTRQGIVEVQPHKLPGKIEGVRFRDLSGHRHNHDSQFDNDDNYPLIDCRDRLSGYDWVINTDVDEIVLPRINITLKSFIKDLFAREPLAAGFYFYIMFHYTSWGKTRNHSSGIEHFDYSRSTRPLWNAYKYAYIPHRVNVPITHNVDPKSPFTVPRVPPKEGVIHHVRVCEPGRTEKDCFPQGSPIDDSLLRFERNFPPKVKRAMKEIGLL
ncbi:uncharacterized protein LOC124260022 isoform X3 [Haliotis rubra]|uniref:uncharacterized protein LOC124260022 isoform X3 n=1 Tax=Haliotis rubra TaxID=36100 RepID=UPI001EE50461|nr:uncharacterized protein LOC124260022 isoform X3 [Haliotis rubra]